MEAMAETPQGTVLVVDDEPTILEVVGRYMERAGYETHRAADGPEALRQANLHRPDLVVLDLMLPGVDGIEVMRQLHDDPPPGARSPTVSSACTAAPTTTSSSPSRRPSSSPGSVRCCAGSRPPTRRRRRSSTARFGSSRRPAASCSMGSR